MGGNELDKRFRLVQSATACIPRHKSRVHHTRGAGQTPRGSRASSKRDIQKAQSKRRRMREPRHRLVRAASLRLLGLAKRVSKFRWHTLIYRSPHFRPFPATVVYTVIAIVFCVIWVWIGTVIEPIASAA